MNRKRPAKTVKTLFLFRHSLRDGENISEEGFRLAIDLGEQIRELPPQHFDIVHEFGSPMSRCWQTLAGIKSGYADAGLGSTIIPHQPVFGLGDAAIAEEILTDEFKAAVASGMSNFHAAMAVHPDKVKEWAAGAFAGLSKMFKAMDDEGPVQGIGVFHSPFIELLAWLLLGLPEELPEDLQDPLKELDGFEFYQTEDGTISVGPKLRFEETDGSLLFVEE